MMVPRMSHEHFKFFTKRQLFKFLKFYFKSCLRLWHFKNPSREEIEMATRVLQGQINTQRQIFPDGTVGDNLDILSRQKLFNIGKNYGHGTGHGIGMFLNVHEYPVGIGTSYTLGMKEGMVTSIEPGYYEENKFGIRFENGVIVRREFAKYYLYLFI